MTARHILALDIGSNSVGSMWLDHGTGAITTGTSIFPAGVDETEDKRGDPKNAKRRMTRRTRITLRRRAERKRELRLRLIACGLLPPDAAAFKKLLEKTDPWTLRREGLDKPLTPHQFGRVLLHLAQRRGALGLSITIEENEEGEAAATDDGKVKKAIGEMRLKMIEAKVRTFGEFIAKVRAQRIHKLPGPDPRPKDDRNGPREYRDAIRNKAGNYEHCADRAMIRDEFAQLWDAQTRHKGETGNILSDALRAELDNEEGDSTWRHKGLLFGQRRQTWDLGTLGRCVLEPTERCAPHADMHASRYRVVETVNNLKIIERGKAPRSLSREEREKIKQYLSGPLGTSPARKIKGKAIPARPKQTVSVTDLRELMGWGRATKATQYRFNIETDEDREINTDWFSREIIHGAIGADVWAKMPESLREGINHAILSHDPAEDGDEEKLRSGKKGNKHPFRRRAGDPAAPPPNNLLDYGYAALRAAVARALVSAGLLPALGIRHRGRSNPFCLADDLMEPLRPLVDRRVRFLAERGDIGLDQTVKAELLRVLTDEVRTGTAHGPLLVAVSRYVASFVRVLMGDQDRPDIPQWPESERTAARAVAVSEQEE